MTHIVNKLIKGHRYAYEYKSIYDPKRKRSYERMIRYLGRCDENGKILEEPKIAIDAVQSSFPVGPLVTFYATAKQLQVHETIRKVLNCSEHEAAILLMLALNQATARVPLSHLAEWVKASPLPQWLHTNPDELNTRSFEDALTSLCHLTPQKTWENKGIVLQHELTKVWRGSSREPAGAYYDITKQAYYGNHCPYASLGHDERGTGIVIGFGMVVSKEHAHPLLCQALPGGQHDSLSVTSTLEILQAQGLKHVTMVMDRGMTAKANVERARAAGYHVVGCVRGWNETTVSYAAQWPGEELEQPAYIVATSHEHAVYARAFTAPLMGFESMRITIVESLVQKAQDRQARDLLLQELEGPVSKERRKELCAELRRVIIPCKGRRGFRVNPTAVERERSLDGRFLLFSTDLSLDGKQMYETYFAKDTIEKVFRTSKGDLSLGPVRYRRQDRLDAYATVIYIAYLLWSWAERHLREKYPAKRLAEALRLVERVSWVRFGTRKYVREWATKLTKEQEQILTAVGAVDYLLHT